MARGDQPLVEKRVKVDNSPNPPGTLGAPFGNVGFLNRYVVHKATIAHTEIFRCVVSTESATGDEIVQRAEVSDNLLLRDISL